MIVFFKKSSHSTTVDLFFDEEQTLFVTRKAVGLLARKETAEN